jgi:hypothetical protein
MAGQGPLTGHARPAARFHEAALIAMLASGYLAMLGSGALDFFSAGLAGAAITLRLCRFAGWVRYEITPPWLRVATLAYILFFPIDYYYVSRDFLDATVHLVIFLAAAKVLTASTRRDYFFLKIIAMLELLSAALLSASPTFFVFLVTFLLATVAALTERGDRVCIRPRGHGRGSGAGGRRPPAALAQRGGDPGRAIAVRRAVFRAAADGARRPGTLSPSLFTRGRLCGRGFAGRWKLHPEKPHRRAACPL